MRYDEHDGQWLAGEAAGSGRHAGWQAEVWAVWAAGSVLAAGDDVDEDDEDEDDEDEEDEDEDEDETEGVAGDDDDEDDEDDDDEDDEEELPDVE